MHRQKLTLAALAVIAVAPHANAATATASFDAHVKVVAACETSATPMDFGTLTGLIKGNETATSTLTVTCTKDWPYTLTLENGSGSMSGTGSTPTDKVGYSASLANSSDVGQGHAQTFTINGQLNVQDTPSAQDYRETRTVTITY
jgi:spore coat protein U-like protein